MTAMVAPVRAESARQVPVLAREVKPRVTSPASEPAAVALGASVRVRAVAPAATEPVPLTAILALAELAATARSSC